MKNKYLVVINPGSGHGKGPAIAERLVQMADFDESGSDVIITKYKDHAVEIVNTCDLNKYVALIVLGGDGTIHEVINGMLKRKDQTKIPIGAIPAGTGNSLLHDFDCTDADESIRRIFDGATRKVDVLKIRYDEHCLYSVNMVGCGLPAVVNHYAGKLRILKSQRYNAGAIWAIVRHKSMCMEVDVPGLDDIIVSDFVLGSNTVHVGTGLKAAPAALTDDGLLDLFILKPGGRASTARIFSELLRGTHLANPRVVCMQVSEFSVASKEEAQLNIDGENYRFSRLNVSVLPEEIDFLL